MCGRAGWKLKGFPADKPKRERERVRTRGVPKGQGPKGGGPDELITAHRQREAGLI